MRIVTLEDICTTTTSSLTLKELEKNEGIYPLYGASGLIKYIDFYKQEKEYIGIVKDGAGIGRIMFLPKNSSVLGTVQYIFPNKNIDIKYLYFNLIKMNLKKYYSGSTIPHIYFKDYKKEKIKLYDLAKQKKIVKILENISEIIEKKKNKLQEYNKLSKCLFVEMFGDPILNEKNWSKKSYEEMSTLITDGEHQTPKRIERGIYLLSARNIYNHHLKLEDVDYITEEEYIRISKRIVPKENDILISCSGSIGRVCLVPKNLKFQLVRSVALIRVKENINPIFMEYLIASDFTQNQIKKETTKSSQANLFQGKIKKLVGIIPPIELQNKFAERIKLIEKSKFEIQKSIDETQKLFDSLMDKYFG